jgi:hypothetical protein
MSFVELLLLFSGAVEWRPTIAMVRLLALILLGISLLTLLSG